MISGRKIMVATSMMPSVLWLDAASHNVRLLFASVEEGMTNGNMEKPAVRIIPAIALLLKINAKRSYLDFAADNANAIPPNPSIGASIIHG